MKTTIDSKSVLIGIAIGAAVVAGIGAASSPGGPGRYQIAGTGNNGMVLDTATGQVWTAYLNPNGGRSDPDFFQPKAGERK